MLLNLKIHRHLKQLCGSWCLQKCIQIETNICCFYTLKNTSNMTCPIKWCSDIVYSDHVVRMHAIVKHLCRFNYKLHTWRGTEFCLERNV